MAVGDLDISASRSAAAVVEAREREERIAFGAKLCNLLAWMVPPLLLLQDNLLARRPPFTYSRRRSINCR